MDPVSNTSVDAWNIGAFHKNGIWAFYVTINYSGAIGNALLIWSILQAKEKKAGDIFIIGLCSGCMFMSLPCASQCAINLVLSLLTGVPRFRKGVSACFWEAYFHVSAIMVQFFSITLIALRSFLAIVKEMDIPVKVAVAILFAMWAIGLGGTYAFGLFSDIYLMPAGAYCFYRFNTPAIVYWFVPTMLLALVCDCYCYWQIFGKARDIGNAVERMQQGQGQREGHQTQRIMSLTVAKRSIIFVLVFFFGWFPAVVACVHALIHGDITEEHDVVLGIFGSLHSIWVPIVYGYHHPKFRKWLARFWCCRCIFQCLKKYRVERRGNRVTVITAHTRASEAETGAATGNTGSSRAHGEGVLLLSLPSPDHSGGSPGSSPNTPFNRPTITWPKPRPDKPHVVSSRFVANDQSVTQPRAMSTTPLATAHVTV